jgi:anhydro-N-acetylmuramic acid kinase
LGSGQHLATTSGKPVVSDFRTLDIALGGQGAPLVPIGDQLFFGGYTHCLNLGGISNVSFDYQGKRVAYDIGLANMLLNYLAQKIGLAYDSNGEIARSGAMLPKLFDQLNVLDYHRQPFPKSTGYEWFLREVVPIFQESEAATKDLLHTAVHHICEQIAVQLRMYGQKQNNHLLITGGGAMNGFLIEVLKEKLGPAFDVSLPDLALIGFKEALVFALMGALRLEGHTNVLRSVTGASRDSSSGVVYYP